MTAGGASLWYRREVYRGCAPARDPHRVAHGDWQTPAALAEAVLARVVRDAPAAWQPASVLEPTCGTGAFLRAAAGAFAGARIVGYEVSHAYVEAARASLTSLGSCASFTPGLAAVEVADFFAVDWPAVVAALPEPILVVGNPPWVTSATLGTLGALGEGNAPAKSNFHGRGGMDALTGRSNFDVSESMLWRLLEALRGRDFRLAMLCKATVARRLLERVASSGVAVAGQVHAIDGRLHFRAAASAVLLALRGEPGWVEATAPARWPVFVDLGADRPVRHMGVAQGRAHPDADAWARTAHLEGETRFVWRSGVKHDCAPVMELAATADGWQNGLGERVDIEDTHLHPLLKGSDIANGRLVPARAVVLPQHRLGDDTARLRHDAPRTHGYLDGHRARLAARKSRVYRGRPEFAVFGVGPYSFAPFKVALCGLYKRLAFVRVDPHRGRPVMLDDTCTFLPCESAQEADALLAALRSPAALEFFAARVFWDDKRPLGKALLQALRLETLLPGPANRPPGAPPHQADAQEHPDPRISAEHAESPPCLPP